MSRALLASTLWSVVACNSHDHPKAASAAPTTLEVAPRELDLPVGHYDLVWTAASLWARVERSDGGWRIISNNKATLVATSQPNLHRYGDELTLYLQNAVPPFARGFFRIADGEITPIAEPLEARDRETANRVMRSDQYLVGYFRVGDDLIAAFGTRDLIWERASDDDRQRALDDMAADRPSSLIDRPVPANGEIVQIRSDRAVRRIAVPQPLHAQVLDGGYIAVMAAGTPAHKYRDAMILVRGPDDTEWRTLFGPFEPADNMIGRGPWLCFPARTAEHETQLHCFDVVRARHVTAPITAGATEFVKELVPDPWRLVFERSDRGQESHFTHWELLLQ